jgi:Ca2+-binding RTX toxin-like protein
MVRSLASRCLTATVIATVLIGIMMVAPVAAADPKTQDGPRSTDQNWTGVSSDRGVEKGAPAPGDVSAPGHDNATDVPGQVVRTPPELSGPIVTPAGPSASEIVRIRTAIAASGKARVNVTTTVPRGLTARNAATDATASKVKGALDGLRDRVRSSGARELGRITVYPWATYSVTAAGLNALLADANVTSVTLDAPVKLALDSSTNIVKSTQLNAAGTRGNGYALSPVGPSRVVIIDSGVDNDHAAFAGKVVSEACFSAGANCPGGVTSTSGPDTAENCTYDDRCAHGTHTASIAAGLTYTGGHEGVAPGAQIVPIQVGSLSATGWTAMLSDINNALQYASNLKTGGANIVAVNLSLHIPDFTRTVACDAENGDFAATQALAATLQGQGVAVVAAAGNDNDNGVSYPACLTSVFAVSATNGSTTPAGFTNSGALTNWWAPGVGIDAAVPGATAHQSLNGTSTAAPHVTGAFALLRQCVDGNGVQISNGTAVNRLNATGPMVSDHGATQRRIQVFDAARGLVNNDAFSSPENLPATGPFNDFDFNICSTAQAGEPGPFSIDNGVWWTWTPAATGTATLSTDDGGGNVTTFDTTLTLYTGSSISSLRVIAADDDGGVGLKSLITVPVNGGTTYRIKVDGFAASTGLLNLHMENNAPPTCQGVAATIVGTAGNDVITGTSGADVIVAGDGNDTINGGGGNDRICGDKGRDTINGETGHDFVFGGTGPDLIRGGMGNDILIGNPGSGSTADTGDVISGGAGDDILDGWVGNDRLSGGGGDDIIGGAAGIDTADYGSATAAITASLAAGTATGWGSDTFSAVENLIGSNFNDSLTGDVGPNSIGAGNGNDDVRGGGGLDALTGGTGNDDVRGGGGNDSVLGNSGNDSLRGEAGTDVCNGGPGTDTAAANCETIIGVP